MQACMCVCVCVCNIRVCVYTRLLPFLSLSPFTLRLSRPPSCRIERPPSRLVCLILLWVYFPPPPQPNPPKATHCWTLGRNLWKKKEEDEEVERRRTTRRKRRSCGELTRNTGRWESDGEAGGKSLKKKNKCTRNATNIGPLTAQIKRVCMGFNIRFKLPPSSIETRLPRPSTSLFSPSSPFFFFFFSLLLFLLLCVYFNQRPSPLGVFVPDK